MTGRQISGETGSKRAGRKAGRQRLDENGLDPNKSTPFAMISFGNWIRLLREFYIEPQFLPRARFITLTSALTTPLRLYERIRYRDVIENTPIPEPLLVILGHPRSGTTWLHYLLARDEQWGYPTSYQCMVPEFSLVRPDLLKPLLARVIPATRIADNMDLDSESPQELENCMGNTTPYSFYHYFMFPTGVREHVRRTLLDGVPPKELEHWKKQYLRFVRRTVHHAGGRPLVLKNPAHTGRVKVLLEMFPDAKFVFIHRNPYLTFLSNRKLHKTLTRYFRLLEIDDEALDANILLFYRGLMQRYLEERSLIPASNLVEVAYDDLESAPLGVLRQIYDGLGLPGFAAAEEGFRAYIAATASYHKNTHAIDDRVVREVNRNWGFAFDEWDYKRLRESGPLGGPGRRVPVGSAQPAGAYRDLDLVGALG